MERKIDLALSTIDQILLKEPLRDKILQDALVENPRLGNFSYEELQLLIRNSLEEIVQLEEVAWHHKRNNIPISPEVADRIKAVLVVSGPGTWYQARKEDRYKNKPWAAWMDHDRLAHAAWLIRRITEIKTRQRLQGKIDTLDERVQLTKEAVSKYGPYFIYTGRKDEREAVKQALTERGVIIPPEKVYLIEEEIDNTVDQVKTLHIPSALYSSPGDRLAIVAHSPQLVRMGHMLEQYKPFPQGIEIQPFPLPIPKEGIPEYPEQEIRGLLYYTFIRGDATKEPYPYVFE